MVLRVFRRRHCLGFVALLAPGTALAQQAVPPPIQPAAGAPQSVPANSGDIDIDSPMAPLPDIGVEWPDLAKTPAATDVVSEERAALPAEAHYSWRLQGLDGIETGLVRQRFDQLSTLSQHDGDVAAAAQIDRRAREDSQLLVTLLRAEGYYDARVSPNVEPDNGRILVTLEAEPGSLYRFKDVTLEGVLAAGGKASTLQDAFAIKADDPANADAVVAGETRLAATAGQQGFPFAKIGEPEIVVDHETKTATLAMAVDPGTARKFGKIVVPDARVFGAKHVQDIARFEPGDEYNVGAVDDLRRALIQTGLVSSAEVKPIEGSSPETVDIQVAMEPAPPHTIAGELGYNTGEGARAELSWTHRNLIKPEGALTLRGVLGTREQAAGVNLRFNNFHGRDRILNTQLLASHTLRDAYEARTLSISGSLERQTNIFFQKAWTWSLGAELAASDERDVIEGTTTQRRRTYFIAALPTSLNYDGTDDLLNPTRGFRLGGRLSPELSLVGQAFGYARTQIDASAYKSVSNRVVLAGRVRFGTILGAPRDAIAPSRRFYAGGGASVRGYGYQAVGPVDANGDPIGGRSLAEFSLEARVRAFGNFGIVPFLDAGNVSTDVVPRINNLRYGTGLGVRYYSNFGPIRLDVGTPINRRPGEPRIAVYVSLGQAF